MTWYIIEILFSIVQIVIIIDFLNRYLGYKGNALSKKITFTFMTIIFVIYEIFKKRLKILIDYEFLVALGLFQLYAMFFLKGGHVKKIITVLFTIIGEFTIAAGSIFIIGVFVNNFGVRAILNEYSITRFVLLIISNSLIFYMSRILLKSKNGGNIKFNDFLILVVFPMISGIFLSYVYFFLTHHELDKVTLYLITFMILFVAIINALIYWVYIRTTEQAEKQANYIIIEQKNKILEENAKDVEKIFKEASYILHDLKNYFSVAIGYIDLGKTNKAKRYLMEIHEEKVNNLSYKFYCDNEYLNFILNSKASICKAKKIDLKVVFFIPVNSDNLDIGIIIANLLDNAIEASEKAMDKMINMTIDGSGNYLRIMIKNTTAGNVLNKNPDLLTKKRDKKRHGLGVKSVKETLTKYNGTINFVENNGFFIACATMIFPITSK